MLVACWSAKGGAGTTVVSATLGLLLARSSASGSLLVDLAGDVPATLARPEPLGPGLTDWLAAGPQVPVDALRRLEVDGAGGARVVPRGQGPLPPSRDRAEVLAAVLAADPRPVVVDCGSDPAHPVVGAVAAAGESLLVTRACYLALRRALASPIRPTGVVLVREPERSLGRPEVEELLRVPVRVEVPFDVAVARAVDAGQLPTRLPRTLEKALRRAA